eukprot:NODE_9146_length_616_cov_93.705882_g8516_i0.p1 GENE.NODE_9146_length_616_cov_93.705882_g8516_i0~~NODE_9146_length_616_cov_93.705882_g8516_i0.p1  ORF type:complete len:180 (+),score=32.65 NODE_9146_length_616_cov_93.705882_g8516_i0:63-542(+)
MPHAWGFRARTRRIFAKAHRRHGLPIVSTYLVNYKVGDYVDVKVDAAIQKGMPHKVYHGRTGQVWNVTPRAVGLLVNKRVRQRVIRKKISVRIEHVKLSRCQEEFKKRVAHNEEVKKTGKGKKIRRDNGGPKGEQWIKKRGEPVPLGAKKFIFTDVYDY